MSAILIDVNTYLKEHSLRILAGFPQILLHKCDKV